MKGIILAGGLGTRLYPLTKVVTKQLLPIYDKPMIYYPLSTLLLAGIRDILIISTKDDIERYKNLLGDGMDFGICLSYEIQEKPEGLVQAFLIGEEFIGNDTCALALGDNIFYGADFDKQLQEAVENAKNGCATIFGYQVKHPEQFGIVEFDNQGNVISLEEKPKKPKSNYCVPGLYFYDNMVVEMAREVKPSPRGELEITDLNRLYLENRKLKVKILGEGFKWFDTGTMDSLVEATIFMQSLQNTKGIHVSVPEEIAYHSGWIAREQLLEGAKKYGKSPYGEHLYEIVIDKKIYHNKQ